MLTQPRRMLVSAVALAAVAATTVTYPIRAQEHRGIEIAPALGAFVPYGPVPAPAATGCQPYCSALPLSETRAVAFGGRVTAWLGKRAAIEGSILYGPSGVNGGDYYAPYIRPETTAYEANGNVFLTSVRAVLNLAAPVPRMSVLLMAGPAVIHQFGGGWSDWNSPTSPGAVLGIGLDVHPGRGLACRATIEDYVYSWESPTIYGASELHHDFVFSLSVGPSFGGKRTIPKEP